MLKNSDMEDDIEDSTTSISRVDPSISIKEFKIVVIKSSREVTYLRFKLPYKSRLKEVSHIMQSGNVTKTVYEQIIDDLKSEAEDVDFCMLMVDLALRNFEDS